VSVSLSTAEGRGILLNALGPGDLIGELALLDGEPRSADALVQKDPRLLALQRDDLAEFVEAHPYVTMKLLAALSRKLRRAAQQVQDVALLDVPAPLARCLIELAETLGEPVPRSTVRVVHVTRSELAAIGATRESANKWVGYFERQGLLMLERGRVTVVDPAVLEHEGPLISPPGGAPLKGSERPPGPGSRELDTQEPASSSARLGARTLHRPREAHRPALGSG